MKRVSTVGVELPDSFPSAPYDSVHSRMKNAGDRYPVVWPEYSGAWNAIAYRYLACSTHSEVFVRSICYGDAPGWPDRYIQESNLFGFFYCGLSVIESVFYGTHAISAMVRPGEFPLDSLWR